ncbi:MAG TPA: kelch repeat-containing protein, partial [Bacteroidia bacterium]|nr:kelch repeat-containing protein [Bacteroidia bacterium]
MKRILLLLIAYTLFLTPSFSQGTWSTLTNPAPDNNFGPMILLTDGTVMCLTTDSSGFASFNGEGNVWDLLTPDSTGSYLNGIWTQLPAMEDTRLYCATWVLPDGNLYVAGGEYGSGISTAEIYNTTTQTWTYINNVPVGWQIFDGSSELLYDGTVLQGSLNYYDFQNAKEDLIFNESLNSYSKAMLMYGSHEESSWIKLRDSSIMNVDLWSLTSERYIPKYHKWIKDSNLKNYIDDFTTGETGPAFMLPNGKLFFLSDTTYTAIYTPSGDTNMGTWEQGPAMPVNDTTHLGTCDAPAAMMPNGKILCAFGPARSYNPPVYFYEFNYLTNTFTQVLAPNGIDTLSTSVYASDMLVLPDGTILYSLIGSNVYSQYTPSGSPLASGKPVIDNIISSCPNFKITGK